MFGYNRTSESPIIDGAGSTLQIDEGGIQIGKKSGGAFKRGC